MPKKKKKAEKTRSLDNPTASEMGKKGGPGRAAKLSKKRRSEIASQAVQARYDGQTAEQRREAARKAIQARWAKYRAAKEAEKKIQDGFSPENQG